MPGDTAEAETPGAPLSCLWEVRRRRRGPRPSLSGDQIVAKAIELTDRDGLGGLSMRRLADELGITAMSLYGYVPSKAELLDVMADRAYGEVTSRGDPGAPWQAALPRSRGSTGRSCCPTPGCCTSRPAVRS